MANGLKRVLMLFKSVTERTTGEQLLEEVGDFIDTHAADTQVDENSLELQFVTADSQDDLLERCNAYKKHIDSSRHERLYYKLVVMSL